MKTLEEPDDCRFPFGDSDFKFCAAPKCFIPRGCEMVQSSYCREHYFICVREPVRAVA